MHGHSPLGKAQDVNQFSCQGLARRGFTVLAVDTFGLGERTDTGHANFAIFASGTTLQAWLLFDNMRALDLLASLPSVDPGRIGVTGSSGGGTQTYFLAALDERVKAAVPVATVLSFGDHMVHSSSEHCLCEVAPGLAGAADIGDVLALAAPRFLLVIAGTRDRTFPIMGGRLSFLRARDAYTALDVPDRIEFMEAYAPHAYARSMREAMYAFFERRLMEKRAPAQESYPPEAEEPQSTTVRVQSAPAETLATLTFNCARKVLDNADHPSRRFRGAAHLEAYRDHWRKAAPTLLGEPLQTADLPCLINRKSMEFGGLHLDTYIIQSEIGILVPALVAAQPETPASAPLVLYLKREGKDAVLFDHRARHLLEAGFRVAGIDVRGTGETSYTYHTEEHNACLNAMMTGRALPGGRALDVRCFLDILDQTGSHRGSTALWVADAFSFHGILAALEQPGIQPIVAERPLLTLASAQEFDEKTLAHLFVPGILEVADLPQLLGMLAPRPLLLLNPQDGLGNPLNESVAREEAGWVREAYQEAAGMFQVETGLPDEDALQRGLKFLNNPPFLPIL